MLSELLFRFATEYYQEKESPFKSSPFANFVRHDLVAAAQDAIREWPFDLIVKASVGQSVWADVPWLAFFDPIETDSAMHGIYVVYLINPLEKTISLSLNQGATAIYNEYGKKRGRNVLLRQAADIADRVFDHAHQFSSEPINLGSSLQLATGYEAGHAFGRTYKAEDLSESELLQDLYEMFQAYSVILERGGLAPSDLMREESGIVNLIETRRYMLSRRIERSPKVRSQILKSRAAICQCCGLDPKLDYGYSGPLEKIPLDVHHAVQLKDLSDGESRRYSINDDFMILCPTCHRMIHKQSNVADLEKLKSKLKFKFMRGT
ncbi:MrcB family domain-containing protein [Snodgrassella sp. CFCC 13594]|uniref:MrcB family domain-containing protein n=1 Tax=Snodgrassella sp. CFCC 13594 TaxID=1775559 RepID=UPI00082D7B09|nr:DUF3578 domain-containing protein [Snodgrassella sp. CFCC 13594]